MEAKSTLSNELLVEVGADIPRSAGATAGTKVSVGILADGELVITDVSGVILDTTSVLQVPEIILVQKATIQGVARLIQSAPIKFSEVVSYKGNPFEATVQQVTYIGYDAVNNTGSFEVINSNSYTIRVSLQELMGQYAPIYPALTSNYVSDATATQAEIANGLYKILVQQIMTYTNKPCKAELVGSATSVAVTGAPTDFTFTYGSNVVSYTGTDPTNLPAGNYIRIGTTDADPLYLITALDTTNNLITLATPYQGSTATILVANINAGVAATINAGSFGIRITGLQQPWVLDSRPYDVNVFYVGIDGTSSTPLSTTVTPYRGNGNYQQIIETQTTYFRDHGQIYNYTEFPPIAPFFTAVTGQNYATLGIGWRRFNYDVTVNPMVGNINIACALDGNVANTFDTNFTGVATSFVDVLDAYLSQNPALSPQLGNL